MIFWIVWGIAALSDAESASVSAGWMVLTLGVSVVSLPVSAVASAVCGVALLFFFRRTVLRVVGVADVLAFPVFASIHPMWTIISVAAAFFVKRRWASASPVPLLPFIVGATAIGTFLKW